MIDELPDGAPAFSDDLLATIRNLARYHREHEKFLLAGAASDRGRGAFGFTHLEGARPEMERGRTGWAPGGDEPVRRGRGPEPAGLTAQRGVLFMEGEPAG